MSGQPYAGALAESDAWVAQSGPYQSTRSTKGNVLGQGTMGLEIKEQCAGLDTL